MKQITSYEELAPLLSAQLRRGVVTNAALTAEDWRREIANRALSAQDWAGGLLLLRRREGHALLSFYLQEPTLPDSLAWDGPTVLEIAARPRDEGLWKAAGLWRGRGFQELFRTLLRDNFDPITGCLPTKAELTRALEAGEVVCVDAPDGTAAGVLHIAPGRGSTQLRHLAVDEAYRRQGGAQALLARYLEHTGFAKSLVWVRTDNEPGRRFYAKNGYQPDGWTSTVLYRP